MAFFDKMHISDQCTWHLNISALEVGKTGSSDVTFNSFVAQSEDTTFNSDAGLLHET